jgi:hypothetical protein
MQCTDNRQEIPVTTVTVTVTVTPDSAPELKLLWLNNLAGRPSVTVTAAGHGDCHGDRDGRSGSPTVISRSHSRALA